MKFARIDDCTWVDAAAVTHVEVDLNAPYPDEDELPRDWLVRVFAGDTCLVVHRYGTRDVAEKNAQNYVLAIEAAAR